ncbi:MAG: NAD-dependent epimerase/dehydratase family protein [Promethearchaeota archaeon]
MNTSKNYFYKDFSNKKILITGGTGFLGANIAHYLVNERKIQPDNIRIFYLENTSTMALEDLPSLEMFPGNILDKESVNQACKDINLIFHTVGNTSFEPRAKKIQWLINVEGTRNILEVLKTSSSIEKCVYTSTVNTLGVPNPLGSIGTLETSDPYTNKPRLHSFKSSEEILEFTEAVHNKIAPKKWWKRIGIGYHDSKLAAQELVNRTVHDNDLNIVSILPGTFFGPYDTLIGNGLYLIRIYNNKMPGVLAGGLPLLHVDDIVKGHILAMERGKKGARYIITGREEDNLYQKDMAALIANILQEKEPDRRINKKFTVFPKFLAMRGAALSELYSKLFNKPCVLSKAMIKAGSVPTFYSYEKAYQEIGYTPQKSFKEAVEDMYEYYKKFDYFKKKGREIDKN